MRQHKSALLEEGVGSVFAVGVNMRRRNAPLNWAFSAGFSIGLPEQALRPACHCWRQQSL